jgi:hypothetical protein
VRRLTRGKAVGLVALCSILAAVPKATAGGGSVTTIRSVPVSVSQPNDKSVTFGYKKPGVQKQWPKVNDGCRKTGEFVKESDTSPPHGPGDIGKPYWVCNNINGGTRYFWADGAGLVGEALAVAPDFTFHMSGCERPFNGAIVAACWYTQRAGRIWMSSNDVLPPAIPANGNVLTNLVDSATGNNVGLARVRPVEIVFDSGMAPSAKYPNTAERCTLEDGFEIPANDPDTEGNNCWVMYLVSSAPVSAATADSTYHATLTVTWKVDSAYIAGVGSVDPGALETVEVISTAEKRVLVKEIQSVVTCKSTSEAGCN